MKHYNVSEEDVVWICPYCFRTFSPTKLQLNISKERWIELFSKKHYTKCEAIEHDIPPRYSWTCPICHKTYTSFYQRSEGCWIRKNLEHMLYYHPEEIQRKNQIEDVVASSQNYVEKIDENHWAFKCPICSKVHYTKCQLVLNYPLEWAKAIAKRHIKRFHKAALCV
jgi:rubrerythrin